MWMRWRTYDREIARIKAAEDVVDAHILAFLQKPRRKNKGNFPTESGPRFAETLSPEKRAARACAINAFKVSGSAG
jgi:hypothetical protein